MKELLTFTAHDNYVLDLCFTRDGRTLFSAGMDGVIHGWSVDTWERAFTLAGHEHSVNSLSLAGDGTLLASGSSDKTVRLWSVGDRRLRQSLQDRKKVVAAVAFSPDARYVAAASYGGRIMVWTRDGEAVVSIRASEKNLATLAFSPDGALLAAAGLGPDIGLWSMPAGEPAGQVAGHETAVMGLCFINQGDNLLSLGYEQTLRAWDTRSWDATWARKVEPAGVRGFCVSPDESLVALPLPGQLQLRRLVDWSIMTTMPGSSQVISSVTFSPDGRLLLAGGADRTIRVWQLETKEGGGS